MLFNLSIKSIKFILFHFMSIYIVFFIHFNSHNGIIFFHSPYLPVRISVKTFSPKNYPRSSSFRLQCAYTSIHFSYYAVFFSFVHSFSSQAHNNNFPFFVLMPWAMNMINITYKHCSTTLSTNYFIMMRFLSHIVQMCKYLFKLKRIFLPSLSHPSYNLHSVIITQCSIYLSLQNV